MFDKTGQLLFVDDEPGIINPLKIIFERKGYKVFTATSGHDGIKILTHNQIDVIISDMNMPQMNGADFLRIVAERYPDSKRILLTGYADIDLTISAINDGKIDYYIAKPWNGEHLINTISSCYENKILKDKNRELQQLIIKQNLELKLANENLEDKVQHRTAELQHSNQKFKAIHNAAIQVFFSIQELHEGPYKGYSRNVATYAKLMAKTLLLPENQIQKIYLAAMLHYLGKSGLSANIMFKPYELLTACELDEYIQYPILGATVLSAFPSLKEVANIILFHRERYNGKGFPHNLVGEEIPLAARILSLAVTYSELRYGLLFKEKYQYDEALQFISEHSEYFDPKLVPLFISIITQLSDENIVLSEIALDKHKLKPGMVLSRDLIAGNGLVLLAKGYTLTQNLIDKIKIINMGAIYIYPG